MDPDRLPACRPCRQYVDDAWECTDGEQHQEHQCEARRSRASGPGRFELGYCRSTEGAAGRRGCLCAEDHRRTAVCEEERPGDQEDCACGDLQEVFQHGDREAEVETCRPGNSACGANCGVRSRCSLTFGFVVDWADMLSAALA